MLTIEFFKILVEIQYDLATLFYDNRGKLFQEIKHEFPQVDINEDKDKSIKCRSKDDYRIMYSSHRAKISKETEFNEERLKDLANLFFPNLSKTFKLNNHIIGIGFDFIYKLNFSDEGELSKFLKNFITIKELLDDETLIPLKASFQIANVRDEDSLFIINLDDDEDEDGNEFLYLRLGFVDMTRNFDFDNIAESFRKYKEKSDSLIEKLNKEENI